jgi:hypothetical protein
LEKCAKMRYISRILRGKKKSKVDIFRQSASGHRLTFTGGFLKNSTFLLCLAKFESFLLCMMSVHLLEKIEKKNTPN